MPQSGLNHPLESPHLDHSILRGSGWFLLIQFFDPLLMSNNLLLMSLNLSLMEHNLLIEVGLQSFQLFILLRK